MIFKEQKIELEGEMGMVPGYSYDVDDVFGEMHIESTEKIEPDILDEIVVVLLRQNIAAQTVRGTIKHKDGVIAYSFKKRPVWSDDDEKEPCESTPTSTTEQDTVSIRTILLNVPIIRWIARFVVAFLEGWKKAGK